MPIKYPPEVEAYVQAHYKTTSDLVMYLELRALGYKVAKTTPRRIRCENGLTRTDSENYLIMADLVKRGLKRCANLYPEAVVEYIKEHFRTMPNRAMLEAIRAQGFVVSDNVVHSIMAKHKLKRTAEDKKCIMKVLVKTGVKSKAVLKGHLESRDTLKDGQVGYRRFGDKKHWVIRIASGQYRIYAYYLWELKNLEVPAKHHLEWIDENAPLTLENIKVVKNNIPELDIGAITHNMHEGRLREYIKVGQGNFQFHETYLWKKYYGDLPSGHYVALIDPDKPITIDNLELRSTSRIAEGAETLADWWVVGTMNQGSSPEAKAKLRAMPVLIEIQRLRLQLNRALKSKHGKSTGNTPGETGNTGNASDTPDPADNPVDGTSTKDEK